jgi:hypothetical protein
VSEKQKKKVFIVVTLERGLLSVLKKDCVETTEQYNQAKIFVNIRRFGFVALL